MATITTAPASGTTSGRGHVPDADVANHVRTLLANSLPNDRAVERRRAHRYPYPHLIVLTPVMPDGTTQVGPPIVAVGKTLSETGLGFFHPAPLPFRRVIASFEETPGTWLGLLMDLHWCRFTRFGWYESGGRFLQIVPSPLREKG
ncbi:MAG: hypothetical protein HYX69_12105 [Planctomycetia bacterium]|nr:hypothetical protein [Planctomycetia bacterium]